MQLSHSFNGQSSSIKHNVMIGAHNSNVSDMCLSPLLLRNKVAGFDVVVPAANDTFLRQEFERHPAGSSMERLSRGPNNSYACGVFIAARLRTKTAATMTRFKPHYGPAAFAAFFNSFQFSPRRFMDTLTGAKSRILLSFKASLLKQSMTLFARLRNYGFFHTHPPASKRTALCSSVSPGGKTCSTDNAGLCDSFFLISVFCPAIIPARLRTVLFSVRSYRAHEILFALATLHFFLLKNLFAPVFISARPRTKFLARFVKNSNSTTKTWFHPTSSYSHICKFLHTCILQQISHFDNVTFCEISTNEAT